MASQSIEDMIREAAGTAPAGTGATGGAAGAAPAGVQIERQNIETVRGQAKSGE